MHCGNEWETAIFVPLTASPTWCICTYMKRTNIYLREDHLKKLKALSEKTGAPVSALIRKAIEKYIKEK